MVIFENTCLCDNYTNKTSAFSIKVQTNGKDHHQLTSQTNRSSIVCLTLLLTSRSAVTEKPRDVPYSLEKLSRGESQQKFTKCYVKIDMPHIVMYFVVIFCLDAE